MKIKRQGYKTKKLLLLLILCLPLWSWSHENNQAQFDIYIYEDETIVEAQFPWAIRDALIQFNPALNSAKSKLSFEETLFQYIQTHLILESYNNRLSLSKIAVLSGSVHHEKYKLTYKGKGKPIKIKNNVLIENSKHTNKQNVYYKDYHFSFELNHEKNSHGWDLENPPKNQFDYLGITQMVVALITILLLIFRGRIFPSKKDSSNDFN